MDIKKEDKSAESKKKHIEYYQSLTEMISKIQEEVTLQSDPSIKTHLNQRIEAIENDKKRIRDMFPDISGEEDVNTN